MKLKILVILFGVLVTKSVLASSHEAHISKIQTTDIGNPYNTVWLNKDITDSPCSSTNEHNRYTLSTNVQHSTALAALMANKKITVAGTGTCKNNIEIVSNIQLKAQ
ncbi:hypothetical protein AADZ84_15720 [Colwelliaceae bacterium MEBiC 14330]